MLEVGLVLAMFNTGMNQFLFAMPFQYKEMKL